MVDGHGYDSQYTLYTMLVGHAMQCCHAMPHPQALFWCGGGGLGKKGPGTHCTRMRKNYSEFSSIIR